MLHFGEFILHKISAIVLADYKVTKSYAFVDTSVT